MARIAKSATDSNTITIAAAVEQLKTNEQALRLALIDIRPDDFDTVKALPLLDFEAVAKKLEQQQQPQFSHSADVAQELPKTSEISTQQELQPATGEPQNSLYVPSDDRQQIANTQSSMPNGGGLSLIEQFTKQVQEEVQVIDAVAQVRNTLILNNLAVRDAELAESLNQQWQGQKQGYLGAIRDLAGLAQEHPKITPDTTNITQEIDSIMGELGKRISA